MRQMGNGEQSDKSALDVDTNQYVGYNSPMNTIHQIIARTHATTDEAAAMTGLHVRTVQRLVKSGEIESEIIGRIRLIPLSFLKRYKRRDRGGVPKELRR